MADRTVHTRMADALADLAYIPKGKSSGVNYEFRGIDALMNHLHPVLATHGLFLSPRVLDDWQVNMIAGTNNRQQTQALFRVCVDVYAPDGSCVTLGPGLAQSHDYGDKAVYQAQQNAIKYVLLEAFCIPTEEQDMDARYADAVPAQTSGAAAGDEPAAPVDLTSLEAAIVVAEDLGLDGKWADTLAYAGRSQAHADKAVVALAGRIESAA